MGFTPAEVDGCSIWQFLAARDGWIRANSMDDDVGPPTPEQHDAMIAKWT
ncbi:MAG TPA: hypothetical protein VGG68_00710 [Caulobacteraceae bacterium]|jgi:hypothetical protein